MSVQLLPLRTIEVAQAPPRLCLWCDPAAQMASPSDNAPAYALAPPRQAWACRAVHTKTLNISGSCYTAHAHTAISHLAGMPAPSIT